MKEISIDDVVKNLGLSFFYFISGCSTGVFAGFILFKFDNSLLQLLIEFFVKRITFGEKYVGSFKLWFILNNLVVLLLIVASTALLMSMFLRKRRPVFFKRFKNMEKNRPQVTLYSMYMIPIGSLFINGFLVCLLLIYTLMNLGFAEFKTTFLLLLPHGFTEVLALVFAASLGLVYLEVLKPYVLSKKWDEARKIGRHLLFSKTTLTFVVLIIFLAVFSGFIEGSIINFLK